MIVLVTGGTGFIGANVVRHLASEGYRVWSLSRHADRLEPVLEEFWATVRSRITVLAGDVTDVDSMNRVFAECRPSHVVHAAAMTSGPSVTGVRDIIRINVSGTINVLDAAGNHAVSRVLYLSSAAVYGQTTEEAAIGENSPLRGSDAYARTKITSEALCELYRLDTNRMDIVIARLGWTYGPMERPLAGSRTRMSLVHQVVQKALAGEEIRLVHLQHVRDWASADDVSRALGELLMQSGLRQHTYNLSGGVAVSHYQLLSTLARIIPVSFRQVPMQDANIPSSATEQGRGPLSIESLVRDTGLAAHDGSGRRSASILAVVAAASPWGGIRWIEQTDRRLAPVSLFAHLAKGTCGERQAFGKVVEPGVPGVHSSNRRRESASATGVPLRMNAGSGEFVGYGGNYPTSNGPTGARIAVSLVVHYQEGAEQTPLDGDAHPELGTSPLERPRQCRDLGVESLYEYGTRRGIWRLLSIFDRTDVKATFFCCGRALERNPLAAREIARRGHEVGGHGYRWIAYDAMSREEELAEIEQAIASLVETTGQRPVGWHSRAVSEHTRNHLANLGFLYDSDSYDDDVPYLVDVNGRKLLTIPYAVDTNDERYWPPPMVAGFSRPEHFFDVLRASFDELYEEGLKSPRMMSVGMHLRVSGRPSRASQVFRFIQYAKEYPDVWFARRVDIARWWLKTQCGTIV